MKIYFEDGKLRYINNLSSVMSVNAMAGPTSCIEFLDHLKKKHPNCVIYTNSIFAFSNKYAWNSERKVPEIYIRDENDQWTRIDELTDRVLKRSHNLARMYIAGEFYRRDEKLPWEE